MIGSTRSWSSVSIGESLNDRFIYRQPNPSRTHGEQCTPGRSSNVIVIMTGTLIRTPRKHRGRQTQAPAGRIFPDAPRG